METLQKKTVNFFSEYDDFIKELYIDAYGDEILEQGIKKGIKKTAKKSVLAGLSNRTIRIITGLTFEKIDKIRAEIDVK